MSQQILLTIQGTIQSCSTDISNEMYCKYSAFYRGDWKPIQGNRAGISQSSHKSETGEIIFSTPFSMSFEATSPFGWPQILIAIYGNNNFGKNMVIGYGSLHIPTVSGRYTMNIPLFVPETESFISKLSQFFTGLTPEFIDPDLTASGDLRRADLHTKSHGYVILEANVIINDIFSLGYQNQ